MTPRDPGKWLAFKADQRARSGNDETATAMTEQILRFAERWASLMEQRVACGIPLPECAEALSFQADKEETNGMTLMMFQAAVRILATFWSLGDALVMWHNERFLPIGTAPPPEGKILDCALVGTPAGNAALIAGYRTVMEEPNRYLFIRALGAAKFIFIELEEHYRRFVTNDEAFAETPGVCPNCAHILDNHSSIDGTDIAPVPNDLSVCLYCAAILRYTDTMAFSVVPLDELRAACDDSPQDFCEVGMAWIAFHDRLTQTVQ